MKTEYFNQKRVPLTLHVLADLDTPLSAYVKLAMGKNSFLLESIEGGEKWGRYSIIGLPARRTIEVRGQKVLNRENGQVIEDLALEDPMGFIQSYHNSFSASST